jgi:hypothetical protein
MSHHHTYTDPSAPAYAMPEEEAAKAVKYEPEHIYTYN